MNLRENNEWIWLDSRSRARKATEKLESKYGYNIKMSIELEFDVGSRESNFYELRGISTLLSTQSGGLEIMKSCKSIFDHIGVKVESFEKESGETQFEVATCYKSKILDALDQVYYFRNIVKEKFPESTFITKITGWVKLNSGHVNMSLWEKSTNVTAETKYRWIEGLLRNMLVFCTQFLFLTLVELSGPVH